MWRVKGRAFPAEGTEWTKDLGRMELGDRLDAPVPVPGGGGHLSLHGASCVGQCGSLHTLAASGHPDTGVAAWGCKHPSPEDQANRLRASEPHSSVSAVTHSST